MKKCLKCDGKIKNNRCELCGEVIYKPQSGADSKNRYKFKVTGYKPGDKTGRPSLKIIVRVGNIEEARKAAESKLRGEGEDPGWYYNINAELLETYRKSKKDLKREAWARWFARYIDDALIILVSHGFYIIVTLYYINKLGVLNITVLFLIMIIAGFFIEPFMLSKWGTTPGKYLLNIRLRKENGSKLNFKEALLRRIRVFIFGQGLNMGAFNLIANGIAYTNLTEKGIMSWDKKGESFVNHKTLSVSRWLIAVIILVIEIYLFVFLSLRGNIIYN
ncbi:MAG: RDD family protein [Elusimicrobiota bacterium]